MLRPGWLHAWPIDHSSLQDQRSITSKAAHGRGRPPLFGALTARQLSATHYPARHQREGLAGAGARGGDFAFPGRRGPGLGDAASEVSRAASLLVTSSARRSGGVTAATKRFARLGRGEHPDRAIADFSRSLQLRGPAWPRSNCFLGVASAHRSAGRLQEAILWTRRVLSENPDAAWLYRELGRTARAMGDRLGMVQALQPTKL